MSTDRLSISIMLLNKSSACRVDEIHNTNEVWKLEKIHCYKLISYRKVEVPYGVNYYGKVWAGLLGRWKPVTLPRSRSR